MLTALERVNLLEWNNPSDSQAWNTVTVSSKACLT